MLKRRFGASGVDVPVVGQGTWKLRDARRAEAALARGLELGLVHVDTAELYEGAEEIVARVLRGHRDEIFLVSKVLPAHGSEAGVKRACEASLRRLGTDHLDVYLLHWPSDEHPLAETMGALAALVDEGKTRFLGVSNFEVAELEEARRCVGRHPIVCNQVLYHLEDRSIEAELVPYCLANDVAVVGYSPFGSGAFPPEDERAARALDAVARRHRATAHQVALAFLVRHAGLFAIPKAESTEHVEQNAAAAALVLDDDDLAALEAAFPKEHP